MQAYSVGMSPASIDDAAVRLVVPKGLVLWGMFGMGGLAVIYSLGALLSIAVLS